MEDEDLGKFPYTLQSGFLLFLFILWMIIGLFVTREVILVLLDHRKIKNKPIPQREYHGIYNVKRKRYFKDRNFQNANNNGNPEQP